PNGYLTDEDAFIFLGYKSISNRRTNPYLTKKQKKK
ncbi:unnamed protein product, partial [Arabidopsis halleri]